MKLFWREFSRIWKPVVATSFISQLVGFGFTGMLVGRWLMSEGGSLYPFWDWEMGFVLCLLLPPYLVFLWAGHHSCMATLSDEGMVEAVRLVDEGNLAQVYWVNNRRKIFFLLFFPALPGAVVGVTLYLPSLMFSLTILVVGWVLWLWWWKRLCARAMLGARNFRAERSEH